MTIETWLLGIPLSFIIWLILAKFIKKKTEEDGGMITVGDLGTISIVSVLLSWVSIFVALVFVPSLLLIEWVRNNSDRRLF